MQYTILYTLMTLYQLQTEVGNVAVVVYILSICNFLCHQVHNIPTYLPTYIHTYIHTYIQLGSAYRIAGEGRIFHRKSPVREL
jgi:hypothetical protein